MTRVALAFVNVLERVAFGCDGGLSGMCRFGVALVGGWLLVVTLFPPVVGFWLDFSVELFSVNLDVYFLVTRLLRNCLGCCWWLETISSQILNCISTEKMTRSFGIRVLRVMSS
jgi:hypothetical protein